MPSLKSFHTFGLNAECHSLVEFDSPDAFLRAQSHSNRYWLLGEGSNTVFLDDFDGTVLINRISGLEYTEYPAYHHLRVGAGENWHKLVATCLQQGWWGLENLALIPGSVGASPIQNIGAYGLEVGQFIESVEYLDIASEKVCVLSADDCDFGYRDSVFKREMAGKVLITHVNFCLPKDNHIECSYGELAKLSQPSPQAIFDEVIRVRRAKLPDPATLGNAGSFFKNPLVTVFHHASLREEYPQIPGFPVGESHFKIPAAWLIDTLGYKGCVVGGARCHPTQPLVLTNLGTAKGGDVIKLAKEIMGAVEDKFAIQLEPEVRLVGNNGLINL
ncbi:UDP-N-acetylmuramate dehydrogenase [Alteromonas aestuariivivens]|uniref:UDP-N-acetylenolpyruvoylglucosamine reductase n=1 Tax=Alteromonas aestuariivivens TaxID=1938339 RepID=A0A3D8M2G8_9ALTE|nr:UDP-N-acetylmuramate dehydrogenase [Alteromonas aestuariivivens]RDV23889.1 UDP-N-acetylmuramate dehydrogenase [Alteromonas aestuariivivens]